MSQIQQTPQVLSKSMYGNTTTMSNCNTVICQTYTLQGDSQGVLASFFRLLANAINLMKTTASIYPAQDSIQKLWVDCLLEVERRSPVIDLSNLNRSLKLSSVMDQLLQLRTMIKSLPQLMMEEFFCFKMRCPNCGMTFSYLAQDNFTSMSNYSQSCESCQTKMQVAESPVLLLSTGLKQINFRHNLNQNQYMLNSVLTGRRENNTIIYYSVFVDFQNNGTDKLFILNAIPNSQQRIQKGDRISEFTFLRPAKVRDYFNNFNQGQVSDNIGPAQSAFYFDFDRLGQDLRRKMNQQIQEIFPDQQLIRSPQRASEVQPQIEYEVNEESDDIRRSPALLKQRQRRETLPTMNVLNSFPQQKSLSTCDYIFWLVVLLLVLVGIFMFAGYVILVELFSRTQNTITINMLKLNNQYYGGIPQVQSVSQVQSYLDSLKNIQVVQSSKQAINRKKVDFSNFQFFSTGLFGSNLQANQSVGMNVTGGNVACSLPTMNLQDISFTNQNALQITTLNAQQISTNSTTAPTFTSGTNLQMDKANFQQVTITTGTTSSMTVKNINSSGFINTTTLNSENSLAANNLTTSGLVQVMNGFSGGNYTVLQQQSTVAANVTTLIANGTQVNMANGMSVTNSNFSQGSSIAFQAALTPSFVYNVLNINADVVSQSQTTVGQFLGQSLDVSTLLSCAQLSSNDIKGSSLQTTGALSVNTSVNCSSTIFTGAVTAASISSPLITSGATTPIFTFDNTGIRTTQNLVIGVTSYGPLFQTTAPVFTFSAPTYQFDTALLSFNSLTSANSVVMDGAVNCNKLICGGTSTFNSVTASTTQVGSIAVEQNISFSTINVATAVKVDNNVQGGRIVATANSVSANKLIAKYICSASDNRTIQLCN